MKTAVCLLAAASAAFSQTGSGLRREGQYWVETANGSVILPPNARFRVTTTGSVLARSQAGEGCAYSIKTQIKARSEAEARRLLSGFQVRTRTSGGWTYLIVELPERNNVSAELSMTVPRSLAQAALETRGGNVEVYDLDGAVEAESGGGNIKMDRIGARATARTGGGEIRLGQVNGAVRCLSGGGLIRVDRAGGEAWFETAGGEIQVREAGGPVRASTAGGNIYIERAASTVSASTSGGLIDVVQAGGAVTAETSGGSIQIGAARGVRCESAAGAIRLRNVSGMLRASTSVGNILAELFSGAPLEESFLITGGGDITVYIPSNLAVTVRAQNEGGSGRIVSDFSEIRPRQSEYGRARTLIAEGALNGGGPLLRLSVSNGTIYLKRQK